MTDQHSRATESMVLVLLALLVLMPPLAMGGVAPWARSVLFLAAAVGLALWLVDGARTGRVRIVRHPVWLFVALFLSLALVQLIPFRFEVLSALQPSTAATYARTLPGYPDAAAARTLSLDAYDTRQELIRVGTLALVFFLAVHALRTRRHIVFMIVALVTVGTFESLYGFFEQFSGRRFIFGSPHPYASDAVAGTYLNKNHFAGLLEMIAPLAFGLFFALEPLKVARPSLSAPLRRIRIELIATLASRKFLAKSLLFALCLIMTVAVLFSLSRAGVLSLAAAFFGLLVVLLTTAGLRRRAVLTLAFLGLALAASGFIGTSAVMDGIEDAASGQSAQWLDRLDLSLSSLDLIREYPLVGTGLGTFGTVFRRYQSERFGDHRANYLHNDWLQVVCETGIAGATLLVAGLGILLVTIVSNLRRRRNAFSRWIGIGGLLGAGAMLVHSAFDYNLSRITANGIVFAVILAIAYRASLMGANGEPDEERLRCFELPARPALLRGALVALAFVAVAGAWGVAHRPLRADLAFNRYLAASPLETGAEDYFFLDFLEGDGVAPGRSPAAVARAERELEAAVRLEPDNPKYVYHLSRTAKRRADDLVRERALATARSLTGELDLEDRNGVSALAATLRGTLESALRAERRPWLERRERLLGRAVDLSPTRAVYHCELGAVRQELDVASPEALASIRTALALAPNQPSILYRCGLALLDRALASGAPPRREARSTESLVAWPRIRDGFRKAIEGDSAYAERVFSVVHAALGDTNALIEVTPRSVPAYGTLLGALWKAGDWPNVHRFLDALERMAPDDPRVRLEASRRRATVFAIEGRWARHGEALAQYRSRLRSALEPELAIAAQLRRVGRHAEAMQKLLAILRRDWAHPEALLHAAEIASLPRVASHLMPGDRPLDHLLRLVLTHECLTPEQFRRSMRVIRMEDPDDSRGRRTIGLITGALELRAGRTSSGVKSLLEVAHRERGDGGHWRLEHLVWHFIGRGYERENRVPEAVAAYGRAVEIVPTHRASLERLAELGPAGNPFVARLETLAPDHPFSVEFGGRVALLGYDLEPGRSGDRSGWTLTCYWEMRERFSSGYRPSFLFQDGGSRTLFTADHDWITRAGRPVSPAAARPGEVVVTEKRVSGDPEAARILEVGLIAVHPGENEPACLTPGFGKRYVPVLLRLGGKHRAARAETERP